MTNKTLPIIYLVLLFIGIAAPHYALAQVEPKVKIYGNIYGGGKLAQVVATNNDTLDIQLITDENLHSNAGGLFNKNTNHSYTTYVKLSTNAEIFGKVFGGGQGIEDEEAAGLVEGQTDVVLEGATTWERIFGGGEMADVSGNTLVHFKKGKMAHDAYGGGLGKLTEEKEDGIILPDNRQTLIASADIKKIKGKENKTGNTFVVFDGEDENHTEYEFKILKTYEENEGVITEHEEDQFDASRENNLFLIDHNIYGGGMTAANVAGNTYTHINYGMVSNDMMNFEHTVMEDGEPVIKKVWPMIYNSIANAQFCVFGGGYGYHAQVVGNTNVTMNIEGSHQFKYLKEFTSSFETKWDGTSDNPEEIAKAADEAKWSQGAPGRSCMDIIGGGYNGKVSGSTNVTVSGDVVVRKVYGGGYYASVNETNVNIKSGLFNRIYGGGLIGNIYRKANLTFGQTFDGENDEAIKTHNGKLLVKDAIYGGNDISGTVGTKRNLEDKVAANGITYPTYNPVNDADHGVRMNIYGGLVLGDVYGAGNGNHTGYGNPEYMEFSHSQHPSENYRTLPHAVDSKNRVYKYRPRTGCVIMNLQGNEGENFNDLPAIDKVRIWGRTFGGGNSCNVGIWDGTEDDNAEVYSDDDAQSWHPGDNFLGGGKIEINIGSNVQLGNRNDSHTTPNGLFMGSNGEHMITQHLDKEKAKYYHQYWDSRANKYYPGFVVYKDDAVTPIKRTTGLKAFKAFINNILTKSDNVRLKIADDATNIWMSNFVGGGYRGSMQAETETGCFDYTLPEGVTVGHSVVGGAFNAHIIYRVYATNYGEGTYRTDSEGNYIYETIEPDQGVISKEQADSTDIADGNPIGTTPYDYIKKLYDENGELEGYLRYNFDGGMLAHDSEMNATNTGSRIHKIHNPASLTTADFTCDGGYIDNKAKALVHLDLKNQLQPAVHEADPQAGTELNVHGGIVYGGCYLTGYIEGDSWVDYDCSLSPLCTDERFFDKTNIDIYDQVADLSRNNAMNVFGAGYGVDTHSMGDVYLCIKSIGRENGELNSNYPFIYNVFGGSNMGTVGGSTNVYYDGGKQGTMLGSLYGGGYKGDIEGNTYVELVQGFLVNVYGGSRQANIKGASHVWAYDGSTRPKTGIADDQYNHLIICNMYGGNDISGSISGTMPATWTKNNWSDLESVGFNSYIQVSGTNPGQKGFPLVGNIYGGGNGENWVDTLGVAPNVRTSLLEINGGTTLSAFGGGNMATVTDSAYIFVNATDTIFADVTFTDYQKHILENKFFRGVRTGYSWDGDILKMSKHHVHNLFGGNNVETMSIQPTWNLKSGYVGNVYSGGNMGNMTFYNPDADTENDEPKGLSITVNSENINIESLYGGCRMSDVKALDDKGDIVPFHDDEYGATVNILKGHIGNVYGGNDISGYVYNGTNVNLKGSITGNVYGAGNGNYLYAYDKTTSQEHVGTKNMVEEYDDDVKQYVYWIPGDENATPLQQLLALNSARPHVAKAYLNIAGTSSAVGEKVYISGAVYCGGNASTIRPMTSGETDAHVKFNIGNNVIVNEVFMGSNGDSLKYDANDASKKYLKNFEKVNNLKLATDLNAADWSVLTNDNVLNADKELLSMDADLRQDIYPNLLSIYMRAVDMKAMPQGFTDEFSTKEFTNTWIGTFCMGGNAGSMMIDQPIDIIFPQTLRFFGRIIGGCKDASFEYNGKWHRGGFRMPLAADAKLDGNSTKTKLRMKIRGDWFSRRMVMEEQYKNSGDYAPMGDYLVYDKTDDGIKWKRDGKAWHDGCNVYGGCYQSGDMVGDVEIYIESDMLAYSRTQDHNIDNYLEPPLDESNKLNLPVANVYGAGYGPDSRSFGDAYIYMKDIPGNVGYTHPSVNNIFGGGRNGMLIGNSVIHVHDGLVYKDVVGGSFAAPLYGSSQVTIGYPKFYVCKKSGEYFIDRADKWNKNFQTKGYKGNEPAIKTSIKYFEGTYVPCNVYDQITKVILAKDHSEVDLTAVGAKDAYFEFHDESDDTSFFPTGGWNSVEIRVRGGVYGGGSSLSNSTAALAGSYTTLASTKDYNHGYDSEGNSSIGYGGNSSIIISDFLGKLPVGQIKKDHIKISTDTTEKDNEGNVTGEHTGVGGVYGDGKLVFCEGFRAAELNGYGYAESTPANALMLNSLQRLDLLTVNDCCFKLYGDHDFTTDELNYQKYSLARIGELRMKSSINADGKLAPTKSTTKVIPDEPQAQDLGDEPVEQPGIRNYIGFYNNIHYLGAIVTNDDFDGTKFHDAEGNVEDCTYRSKKQWYIDQYHGFDDEASVSAFKQRNYATARNMVGINSGYCLRVENQYYEGEERNTYYGPIVGVAEVKLLNVQPGEGGGYVYADNIHADTYDESNPETATFMNESGNFVFEGIIRPGEETKQYIVDDCLPKGFDELSPGEALPEQHYWYVIGDTYYYNTTLTAFSYNGQSTFELIDSDPNIIFAGIEEGSRVSLRSVKWQTADYPDGYAADIRGGRDGDLEKINSTDDYTYKFMLQVGNNTSWSEDMPRSTDNDPVDALLSPTEWKDYSNSTPRFNVRLLDNVNNCPLNNEEQYFNDHLSMPEHVKLIIQSQKQNGTTEGGVPTYETKTYNVTLEIVYLQGPSFTGNVKLSNCALPGEMIGFSSENINIKTTEQLPVTGFGWKLVPLTSETYNDETEKMEYSWADSKEGITIPSSYYNTNAEGYLVGRIPALYSQNHWNIYYTFNAGGKTFTVTPPTTDEEKALSERMLVVHNYHKMADINTTNYDASITNVSGDNIYEKVLKSEAKIYIADQNDLQAFMNYINEGNQTENMHFYLQSALTIPNDWAITTPFEGTLHGNGYPLVFNSSPVEPNTPVEPNAPVEPKPSLFGTNFNKEKAKIYNIGTPNGTITTVPDATVATVPDASASVTNCFTANDEAEDLRYGKKAYELSHFFKNTDSSNGYIHTYYANNDGMGGDWRYAYVSAAGKNERYLRTAAPNYHSMQTSHNAKHAPDYDVTKHDCLFFGQELTPTALKKYPEHIDEEIVSGDWAEKNRVYRTDGYYQSTERDAFHYNKDAWAMQRTLTAINFTAENPEGNFYGDRDDRPSKLSSFNSDNNATTQPYSNENYGKVTQNLLVYNNNEEAFKYKDRRMSEEETVQYHSITANGIPATSFSTEYLHLVDKQDFCAPIEFNVSRLAWYERNPNYFAESNNDAWEGICLPFTIKKVTAETNGEITHFYGEPTEEQKNNPNENNKTLHHEYWLRGFVSITSSDEQTKANFQRPGKASEETLFITPAQSEAAFDYSYAANDYLTKLQGYNKTDNDWYTKDHTFEEYKPLTANTPYIISFPGERFYEFDLTGQKITFSSDENTVVPITPSIITTANGYNHVGTLVHYKDTEYYGMNDTGTGFECVEDCVMPFRTYMNVQDYGQQRAKRISISSLGTTKQEQIGSEEKEEKPDYGITDSQLHIYPQGNRLIIESTYSATLMVYTIGGNLVRELSVSPGTNTYSGFPPGIYIVGHKKVRLK